jgi:hypothetical protein
VTPEAASTLELYRTFGRPAAVAEIGGFRPPADPLASWFGRGCRQAEETIPVCAGEPMFPLIQINVAELPVRPRQLDGVAMLVLFHRTREHPFDAPHGDGWLVREYGSLEGLVPIDPSDYPAIVRPFPIRWSRAENDLPGWEDSWDLVDLAAINADEAAVDAFFGFDRPVRTKVGGFPSDIQHGYGDLDDFVFQVNSEEKPRWMWADNGVGCYFKDESGQWSWKCQFY